MSAIAPCLWFDGVAEDAARYYVEVFGGEIHRVVRSPAAAPDVEEGDVLTVDFRVRDLEFTALNGGPQFTFNEAVSFMVACEDQAEIDRLWDELTREGRPGPCGWLTDRYGLSWQIVPRRLNELLADPNRGRAQRAMQAMLRMQKIDLAAIEAAAEAG